MRHKQYTVEVHDEVVVGVFDDTGRKLDAHEVRKLIRALETQCRADSAGDDLQRRLCAPLGQPAWARVDAHGRCGIGRAIDALHLPTTYKALSLWQPWASLIIWSLKRVETRSWGGKGSFREVTYRGPVVIHAAKRWTQEEKIIAVSEPFRGGIAGRELPLGAALGIADLVDIVPTESIRGRLSQMELAFGDYSDGRYAWLFENIRPFVAPIPVPGGQQLFNLELPEVQYAA